MKRLRQISTPNPRFLLLLALFVAGALFHAATLPVLEGNDELLHFNYVRWLRAENRLPDRADSISSGVRQESGQPPLAYWIYARFFDLLNLPRYPTDIALTLQDVRNKWSTPVERWRRTDNLNLFLHGDNESIFGHPDVVATERAARLLSLLYSVIAVCAAYGAAREVFREVKGGEGWSLVAAALFAFAPQMIYMTAQLSNDILATTISTLIIWQTLRLMRRGSSPLRLIVLGVLLGLGGLTKINGLLLGPAVGIAVLLDWVKHSKKFTTLIKNGLLLGLPIVLMVGPWIVWGAVTYHDPLGVNVHDSFFSVDSANLGSGAIRPTIGQLVAQLPDIYLSYWGKFGPGAVWMSPLAYGALTVIVLLSLAGYVVAVIRRKRHALGGVLSPGVVLVLAVMVAAMATGAVQWLIRLFAISSVITGRLMYPAHAAIAILITGGLLLLARQVEARSQRLSRGLRVYSVTAVTAVGLLVAPVAIHATYAEPLMITWQKLPTLQGGPVAFDHTIRFLGYAQGDPRIYDNQFSAVTLCWDVLQAPTRPAAYAIKVFDKPGHTVAERTSVHGTGRYFSALWIPGNTFCEDIDLLVKGALEAGRTYDIALTLIDERTQAADWQATAADGTPIPVPFIGKVISPAGDMSATISGPLTPTTIQYPGFADLQGYSLSGNLAPGKSVALSLLWKSTGQTDDNLSEFIHLVGANTSTVLVDGIPRGGRYPSWAWFPGEKIAEQWPVTLPDNLPPGDYTIQIGFYHPDSGARIAATQGGTGAKDNAATLLSFSVPK